jgi:hypothetical protein
MFNFSLQFHVGCTLLWTDFNLNWNGSSSFRRNLASIKFYENPLDGYQFLTCVKFRRGTNRHNKFSKGILQLLVATYQKIKKDMTMEREVTEGRIK